MTWWKKLLGIEQRAEPRQLHSQTSLYPGRGVSGISSSGLAVNPDMALTLSAVWACVKKLSETISVMPLQLFERTPSGSRPVP